MTGLTFVVLGRSVDARRHWRRRGLADAVNGALLLTVCLALWIGLTASVARPDLATRPAQPAELRL
jgi:hypothetical protein